MEDELNKKKTYLQHLSVKKSRATNSDLCASSYISHQREHGIYHRRILKEISLYFTPSLFPFFTPSGENVYLTIDHNHQVWRTEQDSLICSAPKSYARNPRFCGNIIRHYTISKMTTSRYILGDCDEARLPFFEDTFCVSFS